MSFPRYPEYKDSGVEWLGEVPGHWEVRPIKAMAMLKGGAGFPDAEQGVENEELYFYKVAALGQADAKGILQAPPDSVSRDTAKRLGAFVFPAGSLTFAKVGAALLLARIRQLPAPSCLDNNMMGMLVNKVNDTRFVLFAMSLVRFDLIANPGAVPSLNASQIGNFQLALPPLAEQTAIATFLDRETAKIDALVAEQEKLIALLQEKRQAVTSHAVTKGLDPSVPMKDSGVEWLGEVPAHWKVVPLALITTLIQTGPFGSQLHAEEYVEDQTPVINPANILDGLLIPDIACTVTNSTLERLKTHQLELGDIIVGRRGEMGRCAVIPPEAVGWLCGTGCLNVRLQRRNADPQFVGTYLRTRQVREWLSLESVGSTMDNLNAKILAKTPVPCPPLEEQITLAKFLNSEATRFNTLMTEARTAITLLQERRTTLISAAVTGQIDVRGLVGDANAPD